MGSIKLPFNQDFPSLSPIPIAMPQPQMQLAYAAAGLTLKDGSRYILKLSDASGVLGSWLTMLAGRFITIFLPQYGVAWTARLALRKGRNRYLYVRFPRQLRGLAEELWRVGAPIPVVISIPTISMIAQGGK